jgi:aminopeptidase YwaD
MVQPAYVEAEITNDGELCGSIAVAHRGRCSFDEKVARVATAGAVALVVVNTDDELFTPGGEDMDAWTIPVVGVTSSDGVRLASAATATLIVAPAVVPPDA